MRKLILTLLIFIPLISYSQDLIVLRNGEQIECKITKVDSIIIFYDFYKGERKLSSYASKSEITSYHINSTEIYNHSKCELITLQGNTVIVNTSEYIKEINKWVNLITFSQGYGLHAKGWAIQYYGYNFRNTRRWSIPIIIGIERFEIYTDYFSQSDYHSANMSYALAGFSPFYKLNDSFFLNLSINIIIGEEDLKDFYGTQSSRTFFGLSPSQGIYFIPKSKVGLTLGISVYEKLLSSEVYKNDTGLKLDIGIKL